MCRQVGQTIRTDKNTLVSVYFTHRECDLGNRDSDICGERALNTQFSENVSFATENFVRSDFSPVILFLGQKQLKSLSLCKARDGGTAHYLYKRFIISEFSPIRGRTLDLNLVDE